MEFRNDYEDTVRAESYAKLEFPGTYYLAFRDLPELIARYVAGKAALDFGCGTGRSTRFLKGLGFDTIGIDISPEMLAKARQFDPSGDYQQVGDGDLSLINSHRFNLIFSAFTFDNIPSTANKFKLFSEFKRLLSPNGGIINLVSTPDMYTHEWASFSTVDYPENVLAKDGDIVRIITTAVEDKRPVEDIVFSDRAYREVYHQAGLNIVHCHKPLARDDEPYDWINETKIAPWAIYVLK